MTISLNSVGKLLAYQTIFGWVSLAIVLLHFTFFFVQRFRRRSP